jgi:2-polyprenyl-6-methoxyphenol hydroxylase-like FAD-dependent oxidoreductase
MSLLGKFESAARDAAMALGHEADLLPEFQLGAGEARTGRAVVLGASMAGLLAARALSETFDQVVVVDRDDLAGTGPRKGVPQGLHAHGILAKGREVLEELFPGITAGLVRAGATAIDLHNDVAWFSGPQPISKAPSDLLALSVTRPMLEDHVRARVRNLPNVHLRGGQEVVDLLTTADCAVVNGVELAPTAGGSREDLAADLVVDATGRGNRNKSWLDRLGYDQPREDSVKASIVYATRLYARRDPLPSGSAAVVGAPSPSHPRCAVLLPIEGDRWIMTLVGMGGEIPPIDPAGYEQFAHSLPMHDLHHVIDNAEPLCEPRRFRVSASVRRRYERLTRQPDGYLVLGDALCAFNPVYGQGMTVAAVEAEVLRDILHQSHDNVPRRFYRQAARVIDIPWDIAAGGDLAIPTTVGQRTMKTRILNGYVAKVLRAAETDTAVSLAFHRTVNLKSRPESLFAPAILRRVMFPRPGYAADDNSRRPMLVG